MSQNKIPLLINGSTGRPAVATAGKKCRCTGCGAAIVKGEKCFDVPNLARHSHIGTRSGLGRCSNKHERAPACLRTLMDKLRPEELRSSPDIIRAQALQAAWQILILGTARHEQRMNQFVAWLKLHHPKLAKRIIGSLVVDGHHLTDGQLLAKAREFHV